MRKRDKRRAQPPWYIRPETFKVIGLIARVLIGIFRW